MPTTTDEGIRKLKEALDAMTDGLSRAARETIIYTKYIEELSKAGTDLKQVEANLRSAFERGSKATADSTKSAAENAQAYRDSVKTYREFITVSAQAERQAQLQQKFLDGLAFSSKNLGAQFKASTGAISAHANALKGGIASVTGVTLGFKSLQDTLVKYNRTVTESYTIARNYGQSMSGFAAGQRLATQTTTLSNQKFAEMDKMFKELSIGIPRTSTEVAQFAANIQQHFGGSVAKTEELARSFVTLESKLPNLMDMIKETSESYNTGGAEAGNQAAGRMLLTLRAIGASKDEIQNALTLARPVSDGVKAMTAMETATEKQRQSAENMTLAFANDLAPQMMLINQLATQFATTMASVPASIVQIATAAIAAGPAVAGLSGMGTSAGGSAFLRGALARKASGGVVRGPGGPTGDQIPTLLSDGEYVVPAAAVRSFGEDNLDAVSSGRYRRFAGGGPVRGMMRGGGATGAMLTVSSGVMLGMGEYASREGSTGEKIGGAVIRGGLPVAGAAIGGAVGSLAGPMGTMVGMSLGGMLGEKAVPAVMKLFGLEQKLTKENALQKAQGLEAIERMKKEHGLLTAQISDVVALNAALEKQSALSRVREESLKQQASFGETISRYASAGWMPFGAGKAYNRAAEQAVAAAEEAGRQRQAETVMAQVGMAGGVTPEVRGRFEEAGQGKAIEAYQKEREEIQKLIAQREKLAATGGNDKAIEKLGADIDVRVRKATDDLAKATTNVGGNVNLEQSDVLLSNLQKQSAEQQAISTDMARSNEERTKARSLAVELTLIQGQLQASVTKERNSRAEATEMLIKGASIEQESLLAVGQQSIDIAVKRKNLAESNMLGLAKSYQYTRDAVLQMEKQRGLLTQQAGTQNNTLQSEANRLGITVNVNKLLTDQVGFAVDLKRQADAQGKNEQDRIAIYSHMMGLAQARLATEGKILDVSQQQAEMTKQIREGYMDAMAEAVSGAGEYAALIGTTKSGATQLIAAGAPATFRYGGVGTRGAQTAPIRHTTFGGALSGPMVATGLEQNTNVNQGFTMIGPLGRREMQNPVGLGATGTPNAQWAIEARSAEVTAGKTEELGVAAKGAAGDISQLGGAVRGIIRAGAAGYPAAGGNTNQAVGPGVPKPGGGGAEGYLVVGGKPSGAGTPRLNYTEGMQPQERFGGGHISGPGGSREDRVPALLSNGEFVVQKSAVDKVGRGNLEAINRMADGGFVHMSIGGPFDEAAAAWEAAAKHGASTASRAASTASSAGRIGRAAPRAVHQLLMSLEPEAAQTAEKMTVGEFLHQDVGALLKSGWKGSKPFLKKGGTGLASGLSTAIAAKGLDYWAEHGTPFHKKMFGTSALGAQWVKERDTEMQQSGANYGTQAANLMSWNPAFAAANVTGRLGQTAIFGMGKQNEDVENYRGILAENSLAQHKIDRIDMRGRMKGVKNAGAALKESMAGADLARREAKQSTYLADLNATPGDRSLVGSFFQPFGNRPSQLKFGADISLAAGRDSSGPVQFPQTRADFIKKHPRGMGMVSTPQGPAYVDLAQHAAAMGTGKWVADEEDTMYGGRYEHENKAEWRADHPRGMGLVHRDFGLPAKFMDLAEHAAEVQSLAAIRSASPGERANATPPDYYKKPPTLSLAGAQGGLVDLKSIGIDFIPKSVASQTGAGGEVKHTVTIDLAKGARSLFGATHATDYDSAGTP